MTVIILRALGLGDFLTGVPAYRGLRAAYPEHETVLAAPAALAPLARLTGAIDRVLPTGELEPLRWVGPAPHAAVDLHGNGPASHRLIENLGARHMMAYVSPAAPGGTGPQWNPAEHEISRWCRLLDWYGVRADPEDLRLDDPGGADPTGAVVLHPGASSGSRRWPADRFAAVARALGHAGHHVVITAAPAERGLGRRAADLAGLRPNAVLRTGLVELAAVVAAATVVVSNDTGVSHLATAYGTPSVTLFGPVSPALWGPPVARPQHVALWHGRGDRPGDPHGRRTDHRLLRITVGEVLDAVSAVIRPPRNATGA